MRASLPAAYAARGRFRVTVLPCATGQGSGRLPGPAQRKQDALIKEINRLERGILPGETQPPARPSSGDLAAGATANAQFHHDLAMPPVLAPATTRDKLV